MKTNKRVFRILAFCLPLLLSVGLVLSLHFGVQNPPAAKETENIKDIRGNTVAATRISDLADLNTLPFVNYAPGEFLQPGPNPGEVISESRIELDQNPRADKRGTYRFVFLNLDTADENYNDTAERMKPHLKGDDYYHFTLYLPSVWSACNVYVQNTLFKSFGEIEGYDFTDYSGLIGETAYYKNATEPLYIDLKFYSKQSDIPPEDQIIDAQIVTVHFAAEEGAAGGLSGLPLIGTNDAVRSVVTRDKTLITAVWVFAALVLAIFIFLIFLKRTLRYFPQQLFILGILGALFSAGVLLSATAYPYAWTAAKNVFFALVPLAAMLSLRVKVKRFPLWLPFAVFGGIVCVLSAIAPYLSVSFAVLSILRAVLFSVEGAMILALGLLSLNKKDTRAISLVPPAIVSVIVVTSAFLSAPLFTAASPLFWLLFSVLAVSVATSCQAIFETERKNRYLTANLQNEVSRQTEELQAIILERDKLLGRVSHDMKKPVRSIRQFLVTLQNRESDLEQIKTLKIVSQKTDALLSEFDELGNYAKLNFAAEPPCEFNVKTALNTALETLAPDCEANGVIFRVLSSDIPVFGKPKCLTSVLNNLIINALEHSGCSVITLSAAKKKGICHIAVTDNGKGIETDKNVFEPYYSENDAEDNIGLGLYICKSLITSMGGDLTYTQSSGELTFTVTLPLA